MTLKEAQELVRAIPDFPQPGIVFRDIFPVFMNPKALNVVIDEFERLIRTKFGNDDIDVIAGLDSRGFLLGPILALRFNASFIPIRKKGKLPGKILTVAYTKEYGVDHFEMQEEAVTEGQRVLVVDDLLATGGSAKAASDLISLAKGSILGYAFLIELTDLFGRDQLPNPDSVLSLWQY